MFHPTFQTIAHDESTEMRCAMLVWKYAARFMQAGGGGLSRESANNRRKITDWERAEIRRRLLETGGNHQAQIGHEVGGISQTTVHKIWRGMSRV